MKKASIIYSIFVGLSMILMWVMLLATDQVTELKTEPLSIITHISSELITAILLVLGGVLLIRKIKWGIRVHTLSLGMLFYTVINSSGYYMQKGDIAMVTMFTCLIITTIIAFIASIKTTNYIGEI